MITFSSRNTAGFESKWEFENRSQIERLWKLTNIPTTDDMCFNIVIEGCPYNKEIIFLELLLELGINV